MANYEKILVFLQNSMMMQGEKLIDYSVDNFQRIISSDWVLNIVLSMLQETRYSSKREVVYLLGNLSSLLALSVD